MGHYMTKEISIHAPHEGGDSGIAMVEGSNIHFNPRPPRGGRPDGRRAAVGRGAISIHAPARGATKTGTQGLKGSMISIHAPARGATADRRLTYTRHKYFNPRPREGGDRR